MRAGGARPAAGDAAAARTWRLPCERAGGGVLGRGDDDADDDDDDDDDDDRLEGMGDQKPTCLAAR